MEETVASDMMRYPRFEGIRTFMRLPYEPAPVACDAVILGAPFDTAASFRSGARFGPEAIRRISSLLRPANVHHRVRPLDWLRVVDGGDAMVIPGNTSRSHDLIEAAVSGWVSQGAVPITLGGDHSIALAELRALAKHHGPLSLIHFDAHGDTWDEYWGERYTHGTPFRRAVEEGLLDPARSTQIGIRGTVYDPDDIEEGRRLGFAVWTIDEVRQRGLDGVMTAARERAGRAKVFVSFDIDCLDPAYAPGTGTPEIGGFTTHEALALVHGLKGLHLVGFDVVEVLPALDVAEITALAAATMVFEFLSLLAAAKRDAAGQPG
ncbi:agmatinase [Alicyclobacillus cellulosilyticus]|uniref:Agmatinase n=1 Tax=Alicyclobacillus cellulosilyticus TaxID=1003997 RepID=A0A917NH38_9BACL|nr:agmatinase [Alicyclobacillus cellulosilyticus]GGJ00133.1 agmatinase [Alicyclobacillus cellulosilyticus]